MSLLWFGWAVLVALLLGLAAHGVEGALRSSGRAGRWPWALAMAGSWILPLRALLGSGSETAAEGAMAWPAVTVVEGATGNVASDAGPVASVVEFVRAATEGLTGSTMLVRDLGASLARALPPWLTEPLAWLPGVWAAAALLGALLVGVAVLQLLGESRHWQPRRVLGENVRISPDFGPALLGVMSPRIVLPRWALDLGEQPLHLILVHEREHRAARDTLLLSAGALAVLLAPWNAALWWHFRRLRLAVELDCDRRVLRAGAPRRQYGALLLDIGERTARAGLPAVALSERRSFLRRRLEMMTMKSNTRPGWPAAGAVLLAAGLVVVACETPAPTGPTDAAAPAPPPPVEAPAEAAEPAPDPLPALHDSTLSGVEGQRPLVVVDDVVVSNSDLATLTPDDISQIEVLKGQAARQLYGERGAYGVILITTKDASPPPEPAAGAPERDWDNRLQVRGLKKLEINVEIKDGGQVTVEQTRDVTPLRSLPMGDAMVLVDGVVSDRPLADLERLDIERIEVLKGEAARAEYGERGDGGVIRIWTNDRQR